MHPVRITLRIALLLAGIGALCGACNPRSAPALSGPAPALPSLPAPPAIPADSLAGTEPAQPYLIAGLIKTPCFGNCPAYEAWVYSDGTVLWCGEAHVDRLGTFRATVPPGWLDALFREAENASFWVGHFRTCSAQY